MSDDLLDETIKRYFDATLKFYYFILSTTLAILGLSMQVIKPSNTDLYPSFVFISWGFLFLSFFLGLYWQYLWIEYQGVIHSGLLKRRNNENDSITIEQKSLMRKLAYSGILQILFLSLGILLLGIFKVINFYY